MHWAFFNFYRLNTRPRQSKLAADNKLCKLFGSKAGGNGEIASIEDLNEIRQLNETFRLGDIKMNELKFQFARSSGPGGQNVNKVNSKAILSVALGKATFIPSSVKKRLRIEWRNRINKDDELIIQSDRFRTQLQNKQDCIDLLFDMIKKCLIVPKETSEETRQRVEDLKYKEKHGAKRDKQFRSKTKQFRRKDY